MLMTRTGPQFRLRIVNDHTVIREGSTPLLPLTNDLELIGTASNGSDVVEMSNRGRHGSHPPVISHQ